MVGNVDVRQITDCIREISSELAIPEIDKAEKPTNGKQSFVYDAAASSDLLTDRDGVLEYERNIGLEDAPGSDNEIQPSARNRVTRRGPSGIIHLLFFFVPTGFAMVIVVMTGLLIGASLPTTLPSRLSLDGGAVSMAAFTPIEEPFSGPSAVTDPPDEPATNQSAPANAGAAEAAPAPSSLPAAAPAVVPAKPEPLSPPPRTPEHSAMATVLPPAPTAPTPQPPVTSAPSAAAPQIAPAPVPTKPANRAGLSDAQKQSLLSRGDAFLIAGDVMSARLFYQRGAAAGDGMSALRMGETFDASFLEPAGLHRVANEPKKAAMWYRRARELGIAEAEIVLKVRDAN